MTTQANSVERKPTYAHHLRRGRLSDLPVGARCISLAPDVSCTGSKKRLKPPISTPPILAGNRRITRKPGERIGLVGITTWGPHAVRAWLKPAPRWRYDDAVAYEADAQDFTTCHRVLIRARGA